MAVAADASVAHGDVGAENAYTGARFVRVGRRRNVTLMSA